MKFLFSLLFILCFCTNFAQIQFTDTANLAGVWDSGNNYGVSIVDFNNDGLEDIYVTRLFDANRLFKNNGDGTYTDVAQTAGIAYAGRSRMGIWGDINNDGWLDMYLGNANGEADKLYLNKGKNNSGFVTFTEIGKKLGMDDTANPFAVVFGDIDRDGFLDIYVAQINGPNKMWKNNGNLTFTDYTVQSGTTDNYIAMGAVFVDYDNDRDLDLYLVHDSYDPNILYQNDGTGHFTNVAPQANADVAAFGMGADFGDINNDGWLDLYITNYGFNNLLLNNGDGTFEDITLESGTNDPGMGWGTAFLDIDNSAWPDIYVANTAAIGHPSVMYHNQGNNTFQRISDETPLESGANGYGIATFDHNLDGRIDLFVANSNNSGSIGNHLFINETQNNHHWVKVKTRGISTNRDGIGARIEIVAGGIRCIDEVSGGSGWVAQNSLIQHFGLGTATTIDTLKVLWPSGITDIRTNLAVDQLYTIVEGEKLETSISEPMENPLNLILSPNPASAHVAINYHLKNPSTVEISLWNTQGVLLEKVILDDQAAGQHTHKLLLHHLSSGLYFIKVQAGAFSSLQPLTILK